MITNLINSSLVMTFLTIKTCELVLMLFTVKILDFGSQSMGYKSFIDLLMINTLILSFC